MFVDCIASQHHPGEKEQLVGERVWCPQVSFSESDATWPDSTHLNSIHRALTLTFEKGTPFSARDWLRHWLSLTTCPLQADLCVERQERQHRQSSCEISGCQRSRSDGLLAASCGAHRQWRCQAGSTCKLVCTPGWTPACHTATGKWPMDTVPSWHCQSCCMSVALLESWPSAWSPVLRYKAAGKIRTPRHLLITSEFSKLHPGLVELLRLHLEGGWVLWDPCLQIWVISVSSHGWSCSYC